MDTSHHTFRQTSTLSAVLLGSYDYYSVHTLISDLHCTTTVIFRLFAIKCVSPYSTGNTLYGDMWFLLLLEGFCCFHQWCTFNFLVFKMKSVVTYFIAVKPFCLAQVIDTFLLVYWALFGTVDWVKRHLYHTTPYTQWNNSGFLGSHHFCWNCSFQTLELCWNLNRNQ